MNDIHYLVVSKNPINGNHYYQLMRYSNEIIYYSGEHDIIRIRQEGDRKFIGKNNTKEVIKIQRKKRNTILHIIDRLEVCGCCQMQKKVKDMCEKQKCFVYNRYDRYFQQHSKFNLLETFYFTVNNVILTPRFYKFDERDVIFQLEDIKKLIADKVGFMMIKEKNLDKFDQDGYYCEKCICESYIEDELEIGYYDTNLDIFNKFYILTPSILEHTYTNGNKHHLYEVGISSDEITKLYFSMAKKLNY